jgi:hypothetical protein
VLILIFYLKASGGSSSMTVSRLGALGFHCTLKGDKHPAEYGQERQINTRSAMLGYYKGAVFYTPVQALFNC